MCLQIYATIIGQLVIDIYEFAVSPFVLYKKRDIFKHFSI